MMMNEDMTQLRHNVLSIAVPLALQGALGLLVNLADTIMVGRIGSAALAGVSQANQVFFILAMTIPGVAAGAGVLLSQAWGAGDIDRMHRILAYAYRVAVLFSLFLFLLAALWPRQVMRIYTTDKAAVALGTRYLRIVAWSYLFYTMTTITTGVLRCVQTVRICLYASIVSLLLNIAGNYILIEGHLGAPALGVVGAAIATTTARIGEFIIILIYTWRYEDKLHIRLRYLRKLDPSLARTFYGTAIPVICNEMFWGFGVSAQAVVLGRLGNEVVAANSIAASVTQLSTVIYQGTAAAACILIGNRIGAGQYAAIPVLKKYFQKLALVIGLSGTVVILALTPFVQTIYHIDQPTYVVTRQLLHVCAFIVPFMAFQFTNMMGMLRGGGDVRFQMTNDLVFLWGLTVPLGFLSAFVLHLPVIGVFLCLKCDQVIKCFTSEWRLRCCAWIHDMNRAQGTKAPALRMRDI